MDLDTTEIARDALRWDVEGRDWPLRETSRFVTVDGLRWHVQTMGRGPDLLLVHGTGAATHSWRDLAPLLARHFTVTAPDLPGHGFTAAPSREALTLPGMAASLGRLLEALGLRPALMVGHSAGAAILAQLCLEGGRRPRALVSLNGALLPLGRLPGRVFAPLARLLARTPLATRLVVRQAGRAGVVERLIRDTGSELDASGVGLYRRLVRSPDHVSAVIAMMAGWDLEPLVAALPRLPVPLVLVVGTADRAVPPADAERVRARVPGTAIVTLPGLGHLAHEESPRRTAAVILRTARDHGALGRA